MSLDENRPHISKPQHWLTRKKGSFGLSSWVKHGQPTCQVSHRQPQHGVCFAYVLAFSVDGGLLVAKMLLTDDSTLQLAM